MTNWDILFDHFDIILQGFWKTLILFSISTVVALVIGIVSLFLLESRSSLLRRIIIILIDTIRMLPFLIFVYVLYYGLPSFGIRMSAWTVGIVGLSIYHGAYVAEIFRGLRATLSRGQVEAALAHGYSRRKMMYFLILPQLLLKSGPLMGNQLI